MKGYRTLIFNAAVAALGVAESVDWVSVIGSSHAGLALALISFANMALRSVTTGPVGERG